MTSKKISIRKRVRLADQVESSPPTTALSNHFESNLRLKISYRPPAELKPPSRILRKHNDRQVENIAASIREHGFNNPILVNREEQIVSGYGRWLAAAALGMSFVPVIELEHLSPEQLRLYAIADNKIAEQSEFDLDELKIEFAELGALDLDLKIELSGFATSEIDDLLCTPGDDVGEAPIALPDEQADAITRLGDVWQLGDHRVMCGDSLRAETYQRLMRGDQAAMVFSDPPFNVRAAAISGKGKHKHRDLRWPRAKCRKASSPTFSRPRSSTASGTAATVQSTFNASTGSIWRKCWARAGLPIPS